MSRCRSCTICCRCWMRCSRCVARVSICSFRDGRTPTTGDVLGFDGAAIRGSGCLVIAGRCGGPARWISVRGAATSGAGRGGAATRGVACGAIAGRCGGGAARNAGPEGRAATGGGAAGRAIPGGDPAGRAAGAAAPPGRAPTGTPRSWPDEPVLTAIKETPKKMAARRTTGGSMIATPSCFVAQDLNALAQKSFAWVCGLHCCDAGPEEALRFRASLTFPMRLARTFVSALS